MQIPPFEGTIEPLGTPVEEVLPPSLGPASEWVSQILSAQQLEWLQQHLLSWHAIALGSLALIALLLHFILRSVLLKATTVAARRAHKEALACAIEESKIAAPIASIVPLAIIAVSVEGIPALLDVVVVPISRIALAAAIVEGVVVVSRALSLLDTLWSARPDVARTGALRGYRQVALVIVGMLGGVSAIAALLGQSPATLLLAMGAAGALLGVIFKDFVVSLVANLMVTSTDAIRLGDWVEMKQHSIDGRIAEIKATSVKVQNADGTMHAVPIARFVQEPYRNYRSKYPPAGRRVRRAFRIDVRSIRALTGEELARVAALPELAAALGRARLATSGAVSPDISNLALFRAFAEVALAAHDAIDSTLPIVITQEEATATGQPVEVVCFIKARAGEGAAIEGAIIDSLQTAATNFALRLFQGGSDGGAIVGNLPFLSTAV